MANQNSQVRFGVIWDNVPYDLFSIFLTKDETICVATYFKASKFGIQKIRTASKKRVHVATNLKEIPTSRFTPIKVSFHKSGYIHSTNKKGERLSKFDGEKGIPFKKIVNCKTLFSMYPTTPENYRKNTSLKKDVKLVDVQQYGFVPWQITCYLSKSDYDFDEEARKINKDCKSLFLRLKNYLPSYNLDLIVRFHKSNSDVFPTAEVICYFTGFD